jgi:hypothetical protein
MCARHERLQYHNINILAVIRAVDAREQNLNEGNYSIVFYKTYGQFVLPETWINWVKCSGYDFLDYAKHSGKVAGASVYYQISYAPSRDSAGYAGYMGVGIQFPPSELDEVLRVFYGYVGYVVAEKLGEKDGGIQQDIDRTVRDYYSAKAALLAACARINPLIGQNMTSPDKEGYEAALAKMSAAAKKAGQFAANGADISAAVHNVRNDPAFASARFGDDREILVSAGYAFSAAQRAEIAGLAGQWSDIVVEPKYRKELSEKISDAVHPLSAEILLAGARTSMSAAVVEYCFDMLGTAAEEEVSATSSSKIKESVIVMQSYEDIVKFRGVLSHEIVHWLSREGYLPRLHAEEMIAHAVSTAEFYQHGGKPKIVELEYGLSLVLFEAGYDLGRHVKKLKTVNELETILAALLEADPELAGQFSIDAAQRFSGRILAGWAVRVEEDTGKPVLESIFAFARDVLAKPRGQADLTAEDLKSVMAISREIEDLIHVLSGNYSMRMVPWYKIWDTDQPCWRIIGRLNQFQFVPEDIAYLPASAAKGLAMEELLRLLYLDPATIDESFMANGLFLSLMQVLQTGRAVKKGLARYPGIALWLEDLYREEYEKATAMIQNMRIGQMPAYLQYLEAAFSRRAAGLRIEDSLIAESLTL